MFNDYTAANYFCSAFLVVKYAQEVAESGLSGGYLVKLTRTATKNYGWRDLVPSVASTCASVKLGKYRRFFSAQTYERSGTAVTVHDDYVLECRSDIANVVTPSGSRNVEIAVNETDVKYVVSATAVVANPAAKFTNANARDYDDAVRPKTAEGLALYSSNVSVTRDLLVKYAVRRAKSASGSYYYEYARYATKTYAFIAMDQATAEACVKAKVAQYTRAYSCINSSAATLAGFAKTKILTGATISPHYNGHTWSVTVSVNETDVKASTTGEAFPEDVFESENGRNYDGGSALVLNSVAREGTQGTVSYTQSFEDFQESNLSFQYHQPNEVAWTSVSISGGAVVLPADVELVCRLVYERYESNTLTVT